ncbi:squalene--hopene cyclase [Neobacillus sp. PS3-34]|uniref:squalene--hopene cyclase n=1 Tax=Neobacillus sp. PS3-34 TaxID=3070678 RepID=UPI0027E001BE|nr:squalene--hopene cyclase [Neobacillus sp. PS3-34]WML47991.1 squalene--hopene cyclase [Neobacillus sp. PS3-34]
MNRIVEGISWIVKTLRQDQSPDGSWEYPFETGISTDAYMIILLRCLEINDEVLIQELTERILSRQDKNGCWRLFYDEENGNLSATIDAYYALLFSGFYKKNDNRLSAAREFILSNGGAEKAGMFTQVMLTMTGQQKWAAFFPIPLEMILLPLSFPINFYSFSVFGRANLTPIMILANRKYRLKTANTPDLSDIFVHKEERYINYGRTREWRSLFNMLEQGIKSLIGLPEHLHKMATDSAKQYMLDRIEPDGTLYSYFSSTFLMIFALLSLGLTKKDPIILKAVDGLKSMKCQINGFTHMQYTTATVWNTSLISSALQGAGVPSSDSMIKKANRYLLERQQYKYGDWAVHNPSSLPGGWGFSNINTINPDVDDTTASLRSIAGRVPQSTQYLQAWERGMQWLLSMQNSDGGWPAFEKNTNSPLLQFLPIEKGEFLLADPSGADLTGRTLEFLGSYTNLSKNHSSIWTAAEWLNKHQEKDGSWYGRWGICYIYGTWASVTGLRAVGTPENHPSIKKAVKWLNSIQNVDGGWGESCKSDTEKRYIPLHASTLTHTAWALDSLVSVADRPTLQMKKAVDYLLENLDKDDWSTEYPKGQGQAGGLYIHYHSYRYIFPLLALAHYKKKFEI